MTATAISVHAGPIIGGRPVESAGAERQDAVSPATGELLGSFALGAPADVETAVAAAGDAFEAWAATSVFERIKFLERAIVVISERREDLGRLLASEQGKPYRVEALGEVDETIEYFQSAIECAKRLDGILPPLADTAKRVLISRVPRGVVAAIGPWNFPLGTMAGQVAPALASGNTVVALPAPTTTLTCYEFARCLIDAGLPEGVFNLVTGQGAVVGDALSGHPDVQVVAFTGSVPTGLRVAQRAAGKAQLIELGGNGPTVLLDDADLALAIPGSVSSTYYCAGQNCIAAGRFLVHEAIYDEFAEAFTAAVRREIKLGDPFAEDTTMGPVNNAVLAGKIDQHVRSAVADGAKVLLGGERAAGFPTDLYWQPTVLADVTESMAVAVEETFGPVAPLQRISSETEALQIMQASPYGLSAAVYTKDLARGLRFAEKAPAGTVNVNTSTSSAEVHLPYGGRAGKLSGLGRTQGRYPMEDVYTELKTVIAHVG
ncbi:aldehyde dehydrogenase family protein [Amycolatopsis silviterrae]|uniref:Aldehyde dehydrogenase family protein n=1 Tax=Amycolatopsis silviterrae TaxID=1656914 RepID=A0ABW5HFV6_9PSEU